MMESLVDTLAHVTPISKEKGDPEISLTTSRKIL